MTLEATAQALAPETASPDPVATETTTEAEPDYGAVYDKLTAEEPVEAESEPVEAAEATAEVETPAEPVEAPTDVPVGLRKHWSAIPEEARDAVLTSQREMSRKLSDMGRQVQGIGPIRDVLVSAVRDIPALGTMKPEQVAQEVIVLSKAIADFRTKPLETFLSLAKEHNMTDALRQALGGQARGAQETAALQTELRALRDQVARAANPEFLREQVAAVAMQERTMADVTSFASAKEHWGEVEAYMPGVIRMLQEANPESPPKDILEKAYDTALQIYRPDLKAPVKAAVEAAEQPDPERAKAAIQAKSVNVPGQTAGKPRELTEDERYDAIWEKAQRRK
jgi:hypothetical protein